MGLWLLGLPEALRGLWAREGEEGKGTHISSDVGEIAFLWGWVGGGEG